MKKLITLIATLTAILIPMSVSAQKIGDEIGIVYHTDIVSYINNYAIPSYAANGTSVVVAEDLRNFGFDVAWDGNARTLSITRNGETSPVGMEVAKNEVPAKPFTNILYTDITVYANGVKVPSYAINGYTMIPMESLTMLGECHWVPEERALKMWVDGLYIRPDKQPVMQGLHFRRSIKSGAVDLEPTLTAQQRYEVNIFLSNFEELNYEDGYTYDEEYASNAELVFFGCRHHACNHTSSAISITDAEAGRYFPLDDEIHSCYKVSKTAVEQAVSRYLGKNVVHQSETIMSGWGYNWYHAYNNGYYYFDYGEEGDTSFSYAVVDSMFENNDGTYTVTFKRYWHYLDSVKPQIYYQTPDEAGKDYTSNRQGSAIIRPYNYNGRNTYQLVRYHTEYVGD